MARITLFALASALALGAAGAAVAQEPSAFRRAERAAAAEFAVDMEVKDSAGRTIGRIAALRRGDRGRVVAVLVRSREAMGLRSSVRSLPVRSLRLEGDAAVTALTQAEFLLLPEIRP